MTVSTFTCRIARTDEILALRHAVLRPGRPLEAARYAEDDDPATIHLGAFVDGRAIGCATLLKKPFRGETAWQLRGMATSPAHRRQGVGSAMIRCMIETLIATDPHTLIWCNARLIAIDFYRRQRFETVTGTFRVPDVGPHVRMIRRVNADTAD